MPSQPVAQQSGRKLAWLSILVGALTSLLGLGLAVLGMGFANATASGTGVAAFLLGIWQVAAFRGLRRRIITTEFGLTLGWCFLLGRMVFDLPATASAFVLAAFLLPLITVPLALAWMVTSAVFLGGLVLRLVGRWRAAALTAEAPPPNKRFWPVARVFLALLIVVGFTFVIPELVWLDRGKKIDDLVRRYSSQTLSVRKQQVEWGACTMAFLGYSLTEKIKKAPPDLATVRQRLAPSLRDSLAEVSSLDKAGAAYLRVGASGDHLLKTNWWQEAIDDEFILAIQRTGKKLVLVDTQHPKVCRDVKLSWEEFASFHTRRVDYYQQRYTPSVYIVVCEPLSYHGFVLKPGETFSPDRWATLLTGAVRRIKHANPETRTGICLLVGNDKRPEWDVWNRMKQVAELDLLSVEIYQPEDFELTSKRLQESGHPRQFGKEFWIAETYNGWALASARRWDQDERWLQAVAGFADQTEAGGVLVWSFGTFIEDGSFFEFFHPGRLADRWHGSEQLSSVGRAFADLATRRK